MLSLLAQVHLRMGDLPKAGALLAALGREDEEAQPALAAWRQRHGDEDARRRSIPRPVREARPDVAEVLAADIGEVGGESSGWQGNAAFAGCLLVMLALVALVVVGVVTVVGWIV